MINNSTLYKILTVIELNGGEIYVVGGSIRDRILGYEPKDIDFLVRKLTLEKIVDSIKTIGKANEVGQSFGVVKATIDSHEFDFAIPRTKEEKTGDAHTDFTVQTDPNASVEADLSRRDLTINSLSLPLRDYIANDMNKIIDPNDGLGDLKKGIIRMVGKPINRFSEDYLRILRALQFSARMGFDITGETEQAIIQLAPKLKSVSGERIFEELKKAWTKGKADTSVLVHLLDKLTIGKVLFGDDFNPFIVKLDNLSNSDKIEGQFVAFFMRGGNYDIMKPDTIYIKLVELAKNIAFTDKLPHTYIGNLKDKLPILMEVFIEAIPNKSLKVSRMMEVAIVPKELEVDGNDIKSILNITQPKDFKKIGIAQSDMLTNIWNDHLRNDREALIKFLEVPHA